MTASNGMNQWAWHWRRPEDAVATPEVRLADEICVKCNPVRSVYRRNGCFLKLDTPHRANWFRRNSKSRTEFEQSLALEEAGVPVVEVLGYGECGKDSMLVTREFPDSVPVTVYWCREFVRGGRDPKEFLRGYAAFLKQFFHTGFYHPDFHNGNILYQPATGRFALVDVYGVRRVMWWTPGRFLRMARIVTEFREVLSDEACVRLLIDAGISGSPVWAVRMWRKILRFEAKRLKRELPRRIKQFFADYPKFVRRDGDWIWTLDAAREPWATPEEIAAGRYEEVTGTPEELAALRKEDFIASLACASGRCRIVAYQEQKSLLYRERKQ